MLNTLLAVGLTVLNLVLLASVMFNLPGTWLMILLAVCVDWFYPQDLFSMTFLVACVVLAGVGEVIEFAFSASSARKAGGSRRGALLAIVGGVVGAIVGTPFAPVVGTLLGACVGAFGGSILGDLWAGQPLGKSVNTGSEAAIGRLWGTLGKLAVGGVIVVLLAVDAAT